MVPNQAQGKDLVSYLARPGRPGGRAGREHRLLLINALPQQWPQHDGPGASRFVAQYSAERILSEDGSQPRSLAERLLVEGKRVS